MRLALLLAFLAFPALAEGPDDLLKSREIHFDCPKDGEPGAGKCTLSRDDWIFMMRQNILLGRLLNDAVEKLHACRFKGV